MAKESVHQKKYSFETPPDPIPEIEIKEIVNADIVVAGAGPAGLAAALSAAESGAKVVVLEKFHRIAAPGGPGAPFIGSKLQKERELSGGTPPMSGMPGTPPMSGMPGMPPMPGAGGMPPMPGAHGMPPMPGGGGMPPSMEGSATQATKKEEIVKGLYEASEGRADQRLIRIWAEKNGEVADWLIDTANNAGIYVSVGRYSHMFSKSPTLQLHLDRTPVGTGDDDDDRGGELVLLNMIADKARQKGVDIRCNTAAVRLVRPGNTGRVTGIIAREKNGSYIQFNASKAVILCTGDYGMDDEMLEKYCPWAIGTPKLMLDTVTGDGHKMGLWAGAAMEDGPHCAMLHFNSTNETPVIHFRPIDMIPGLPQRGSYLYVNKLGERFLNEAQPDEFLANMVMRQPGKAYWQVFDAKSVIDFNRADVEKCLKTGAVLKADTVEELAPKFGADPTVFKATVERYNELVKMGEDPDFGKGSEFMNFALDTPPFYVCESPPDLLCTMGGLKRNLDGQVLDTDMNVIPGLYVAGNIAGGFWGDTYPMHFLGGISRSHALVFGRLAGLHAANWKC